MKRKDLSNVKELSDFKLPVGGFIIEIKEAEDVPEKEYLKLGYDIIDAYEEKDKSLIGMYSERKESMDYNYPIHIVSYKDNETVLSLFKSFIERLKDCNNGYDFEKNYDEKELIGKKLGVVFREEEYLGEDKNGQKRVRKRSSVYRKYSIEDIMNGNFTVPDIKKYEAKQEAPNNPFKNAVANNNINITSNETSVGKAMGGYIEDDDCPF